MKPRICSVRSISILLLITVFIFSHCNTETFYRTGTGLLYRVVNPPGKDSIARMGNTVKLHYIQKAGDTIIENNYDKMPLYWMVMPGFGNKYNPLEAFDYGLREGDSVVVIQSVDSMLKKHIFDSLPKYLKRSDQWTTYLKVEKVFRNDSLLQIDKMQEQKKVDAVQKITGNERVKNYLRDHDITDAISDSGVYVQIIRQGNGPQIDTSRKVGIKYAFTNLTSGKMFDTNRDTAYHHPDTLHFKVGGPFMVKAVDHGIRMLREGAHAKIFIPTMSAFGGRPPRGNIHPYDDLMFEVWVLKVE